MTAQPITRFNASVARPRPPLAQVEVLLIFHPELQQGDPQQVPADVCGRARPHWLTLDVYGRPRVNEITGRAVMENMRLQSNGTDFEPALPEEIVNEIADYVLEQA